MRRLHFALFLAFFTSGLITGEAERTKDKIYDQINGATACFRRLNGTHQFGCASQRRGNVGVIQELKTQADVDWLIKDAPEGDYMAVVGAEMFTKPTLLALKESNRVNGVLLLRSDTEPDTVRHFTHDDSCPNRYSGLSDFNNQQCQDTNPWNPSGTALLLIDWGFPIFYVHNQTSIDMIRKCYSTFNLDKQDMTTRSLCAVEMQAFMMAAKDSETCIRRSNLLNNLNPRRYCDPMGDKNIWTTLFPRDRNQAEEDKSVIVLAARLDTTSMFDGEAPGAISAVSGLVSALATFHLLSQMGAQRNKGNVMLVLLNGEAYDYIGSSRLAYDMAKNMFPAPWSNVQPFNSSKIRLLVELNQLSQVNKSSAGVTPMFFHKTTSNDVEIQKFVDLVRKSADPSKMEFSDSTATKLPPVSLQPFVKADAKLSGVALTDYDQTFTNRFYHSIMDDAKLLGFKYMNGSVPSDNSIQSYLANLSTVLAKSIFEMLTSSSYSGSLKAESSMIDELLQCYLNSMNCKLFQQATSDDFILAQYPPGLYVGVANGPNAVTGLTGRLIALLTGTKVDLTRDECKLNKTDLTYQYMWMRGKNEDNSNASICMQTTVNYTLASSPAFEIEDYDWKSGNYSTWTESVWTEFQVRMFLKPSYGHEAFIISFGSVVLFISFLVVLFIYSRSDIFFSTNTLNGGC